MALTIFGSKKDAPLTMGTALLALLGSSACTVEQIDAANQELDAAGLQGAQLVPAATLQALETAQASVTATTDALTAAGAESIEQLVAQRDEARQQAEEFGNQPGELPTSSTKLKTDVQESAEAPDKEWEASHARMLAS